MVHRYDDEEEELVSMSLGDHLEELRIRLLRIIIATFAGMIVCLPIGRMLIRWLQWPYQHALKQVERSIPLTTHSAPEAFVVYMKVCVVFGLVIAAPYVFYQVWAFIAAGLYRRERRFVHSVAPASTVLFIAGVAFFLFVVAGFAMRFFLLFNEGLQTRPVWSLKLYINLILTLMLVFGIGFQMPIGIVFAERFGLVTTAQLAAARRYVILALFIIAAVATPPDVVSQIALAIPLYALFEGSILFCRFMRWKKNRADHPDDSGSNGPTPPTPGPEPAGPESAGPDSESTNGIETPENSPATPEAPEDQAFSSEGPTEPHEEWADTGEPIPPIDASDGDPYRYPDPNAGGDPYASEAPGTTETPPQEPSVADPDTDQGLEGPSAEGAPDSPGPYPSVYDRPEPTTGHEQPPETERLPDTERPADGDPAPDPATDPDDPPRPEST